MNPDVLDQKIQKAKSLGYSQDQIDAYLHSKGITPPASGFFDRVAADFKQRDQNVATAKAKVESGKQGLASGLLQSTGQAAGFAGDVISEGIQSIPGATDAINSVVKPIAESAPVKGVIQGYEQWKAKHPEAAANLEAGTNILSVLPVTEGLNLGARAVKTGFNVAKDAAIDTTKAVINAPGKVLQTVAAKPIPKPVETVLKTTPVDQFDNYVNLASKAASDNKAVTPLEFAGQRAGTALDSIQKKLSAVGKQKQEMMGIGGFSITPVDGTMVRKFRQGLASYINSKTAVEGDTKLIRDISNEAAKLGDFPAAGQVDRFIDFVQDKVYTSGRDLSVPVTDETRARIRNLVESLNTSLKNELPANYRNVNAEYSRLVQMRNELNTKLGKEGEKGGALLKRVFSPSDANTKKLFADVKKETGIDLVDEATLAKFTMEILGDARQKSMLEQLNLLHTSPTPNGIAGKLLEKLVNHYNTPESQIKRARSQTIPAAQLSAPELPKDTSLKGKDAAVQDASIAKFQANPEKMIQDYLKTKGNVVNTDEARKLFSDVGYNGNNSAAVHEAASAVANGALKKLIETAKPGMGYFLAGGAGAGKSTITRSLGKKLADASFILDGNLSNYDSAIKKIHMAEKAGHQITVPYVYRDPIEAWNNGVIKRMLTSATDKGRVVPLKEFLKNTVGALSTVKKLIDEGIPVVGFENLKGGLVKDLSTKDIKKIEIAPDIKEKLVTSTEERLKEGLITKEQRDALLKGIVE